MVTKINWSLSTPMSVNNMQQMEKNLLDATEGHQHQGGDDGVQIPPGGIARNMESISLTDLFYANLPAYTLRTGAIVTLGNVRAGANVLLHVSSVWYGTIVEYARIRISRDSGAEYKIIGDIASGTSFIGGTYLFEGLSAGDHTFEIEVIVNNGFLYNNGGTGGMTVLAEEV
jgi:hypothetical protein